MRGGGGLYGMLFAVHSKESKEYFNGFRDLKQIEFCSITISRYPEFNSVALPKVGHYWVMTLVRGPAIYVVYVH